MFSGFYTTDKGHNYIAKSMAGKTLVFTKAQYGNGTLPEGAIITSMTALISPLAIMPISKQNVIENNMITTTQFSNRVNGVVLAPFHLMEAGIYGKLKNADGTDFADGQETLIFYANAQTTDKADYIPGILTEFIMNWPLAISGSENITVEIDGSLVYPTMEEFNARVTQKATAGGTEKDLTVECETALTDGLQIIVTLTKDIAAYPTISYNGGTAYPIYNSNGTDIVAGQQVAGSSMNLIYNDTQKRWYILGGGSVEIATEAEAKAGTDDTKMMTPKKVATYVNQVLGDVNAILDTINGEVI